MGTETRRNIRPHSAGREIQLCLLALATLLLRLLAAAERRPRLRVRRLAPTLVFALLFFAGAAFSAGAGDTVVALAERAEGDAVPVPEPDQIPLPDAEAGSTDVPAAAPPPPADTEAGSDGSPPVGPDSVAPAPPPESPAEPAPPAPPVVADEPEIETTLPDASPSDEPKAVASPPPAAPERPEAGSDAGDKREDGTRASRPKASPARSARADGARDRGGGDRPSPHAGGAAASPRSTHVEPGIFVSAAPLPDPTPRALRLAPGFAKLVSVEARRARIDWALLLGLLRARDDQFRATSPRAVRTLATRLAAHDARKDPDGALLAVSRDMAVAEQASALRHYNRAVGLDALVSGLEGAAPVLTARVLRDPRLAVYAGGRKDIAARRVDVRVLVLLLYLAEGHGDVTVSSLISGHRRYAAPGRVSAHVYGRAVDIAALERRPIAGNQEAGGVTERAVRSILLLPPEALPTQVISLLDLGGPSFALSDHWDHVHVGFGTGGPGTGTPLRELWQAAGARYGVPWQVLAAINKIESDFGRNMGPSSAGAIGWMQFMPATWAKYGVDADGDGVASPWSAADAIYAAARYLDAAGASRDLRRAIYAYNHAWWYVDDVLAVARSYGWR